MLVGGLGLFVMSRLTSEPIPSPTRESWLALIYLVLVLLGVVGVFRERYLNRGA